MNLNAKNAAAIALAWALASTALPAAAMQYTVENAKTSSGHAVNLVRATGVIGGSDIMGWRIAVEPKIDPSLDTIVFLTSPGGSFPGGTMLMNAVGSFLGERMNHGRKVVVVAETDCSSMCIPLFYTFGSRLSFKDTRFGFHGISLGGIAYDPEETQLYLAPIRNNASARGDSAVVAWLERAQARGVFSSTNLTPITGQKLADEGSGFVSQQSLVSTEQQAIDRLDAGN